MNCSAVESLLLDFIEGQLDEEQGRQFQSHLDACPSCRLNVAETRDIFQALQEAKEHQEQCLAFSSRRGAALPREERLRPWSQGAETPHDLKAGALHLKAMPTARPASWSPGTVLGDFEILGEIGRGGMGIVYRANQLSLNRVVALKVLPAMFGQSSKAVSRFQKEARAAAKLHHTNIVPVYAQGEFEGHYYYAMELIDGLSLDRVLRQDPTRVVPQPPPDQSRDRPSRDRPSRDPTSRDRQGAVAAFENAIEPELQPGANVSPGGVGVSPANTARPEDRGALGEPPNGKPSAVGPHLSGSQLRGTYRKLALLICGVAEGLEHAHRQGVIHRDIKPQNLLLGNDGQLHITDFGLARLLDEPSVTVTGEMLGTPAYMSPEQVAADRRKIDHRTDIYSLGVTFYELLTGRRPFEGDTRERIIARICADEPRPPRKWNPVVPVDLETICLRAIEKNPRRRYQSAGEMAADLRRYAEDRPILSRRVGPFEKAVKWVRRHPALTAIITLSAALVITGTVWGVQSVKARHARADRLVREAFEMLAYDDYRDPTEARQKLAEARRLGPEAAPYHTAVALSRLLEDPQVAVSELRTAIAADPTNTEIMYLLAWALRRAEQNQESRDWLRRAEEAGGATTAAAHFFHAQAVVRTNPEEAIEPYRNACSERKNYAQAYVHLGRALNHWMYHHRKHEYFSEQRSALESACALQQDKAYPRYLLSIAYRLSAEIYEAAGQTDDAERHFASALAYARDAQQVEPDSALGYTCEAEYWESRRDHLQAIAARNRAEPYCKSFSDRVELHQYRWRLYYWIGDLDRAWADLQVLGKISSDADPAKVWYTGLFPALIQAERAFSATSRAGEPAALAVELPRDSALMDEAIRLARAMAETRPTDFRAVTSAASMLRVLGRREEAGQLLADHAAKIDFRLHRDRLPADWQAAAYVCCQELLSLGDLESLAGERRTNKLLWAAPHVFLGAGALGRGDRAAALEHFRQSEQTFDYDEYCYLAKVFVRKLEQDPAWPPWIPP